MPPVYILLLLLLLCHRPFSYFNWENIKEYKVKILKFYLTYCLMYQLIAKLISLSLLHQSRIV